MWRWGPSAASSMRRLRAASRRAVAGRLQGRSRSTLEVLAPDRLDVKRLVLLGTGTAATSKSWTGSALGGLAYAQIMARTASDASLVAEPRRSGRGVRGAAWRDARLWGAAAQLYVHASTARSPKTRRTATAPVLAQADRPQMCLRGPGCREAGVRTTAAGGRGRVSRSRPRQRASQCAGPRRICRADPAAERASAWRSRSSTRAAREARHGCAAGRGPRQRTAAARRRHAVARRQVQEGRSRSVSSARAWCSIPAAFRSSLPAAWRT